MFVSGRHFRRLARSLAALAVALSLLLAASAHALDAKGAAAAMAAQAAAAFQSGDLTRSAQFYLQAFRQDPSEPNYLFGAARAAHMQGRLEPAEDHYKQFLAAKGADPQRMDKARGYLRELAIARADAKAEDAERAAQKGNWKMAAAVWLDAWRMAPERQRYLFKSARAWQEAGDKDAALKHLRLYLRDAPADATERGEAQALLEQLTPQEAPKVVTAPAPEAKPAPAVPPQPAAHAAPKTPTPLPPPMVHTAPQDHDSVAKWTLAGGAVVAVAGLGLVGWGLVDAVNYRKELNYDGTTVRGGLTWDAASARVGHIQTLWTTGGILTGVGVIAAGWGGWQLWRAPKAKVALLPSGQGALLVGRF